MQEVKTGKISSIKREKGYGFIKDLKAERGEGGIFFHFTNVESPTFSELQEGDTVEYLVTEGKKGLEAIGIVVRNSGAER